MSLRRIFGGGLYNRAEGIKIEGPDPKGDSSSLPPHPIGLSIISIDKRINRTDLMRIVEILDSFL